MSTEGIGGDLFKPEARDYARAELAGLWRVMVPVVALIVAATAVGAAFDVRWLFVGLMVLFVLTPMAMFFVWLRLTGRTDMRLRLRPQRWTVSKEGLRIDFYAFDEDAQGEALSTMVIGRDEIESLERHGEAYYLRTRHKDAGLLIVGNKHIDGESVKILSKAAYDNCREAEEEDLA